uniref:NAD(P)H-dependent oxidoreductase n=1 Tax=uncultured Altererythrobacter sp. TaxID=500840 RepID=UPI00261A96FA|nr:NAD(P)H-dependent oxidoreductase [uncultured Altererythrobacter sp.]
MNGNNILIINMHGQWEFSPGGLSGAVVDTMSEKLRSLGYDVRASKVEGEYSVEDELEKHLWADIVIHQIPVNWMGVPWKAKKYMDEVYMAGISGQLCNGDGRNAEQPKKNYGTGGTQKGKRYMLSLTFNAPEEAFGDPDEWFFQGKSVDDLFLPHHLNFRFFDMEPLETFVIFDVLKNPQVETAFEQLDAHLESQFVRVAEAA